MNEHNCSVGRRFSSRLVKWVCKADCVNQIPCTLTTVEEDEAPILCPFEFDMQPKWREVR